MLSVLLATHNGADTIERTLAAMAEVDAPPGGWKLVIVNNASTDDTERRVLNWKDRLPLEYIVEPRLGKSVALNTAFSRAEGDLIVLTDDDVLPAVDWLKELRRVADTYPQCSAFGGAIIPEFDGGPPTWPMPDWCLTVLYGRTPVYAEGEIGPMNVSGANMALRKSVYDEGWRFDEQYLVGSNGLMGEDSDLVRRLGNGGHKIGFAPTSRIRHIIHKRQTSLAWIYMRLYRHGRTMFMFEDVRRDPASGSLAFDFPWTQLFSAGRSILRLGLASLRWNKTKMFQQILDISYGLGAVHQALTLARNGRTTS